MNENIVKETCDALGITQKELGELMGVNPGTPAQWSSKGDIPETARKFMQTLVQHKEDKEQLEKLTNALDVLFQERNKH